MLNINKIINKTIINKIKYNKYFYQNNWCEKLFTKKNVNYKCQFPQIVFYVVSIDIKTS